jgi:hypothetical protein
MKPRVTRPRFLKVSYLLWIAVPLALYAIYQAYGLPHGIWSSSFIDEGQGHSPYAHRTYTRCHFIGPYGGFTVPAQGGRCGWVRFFKAEAENG